MEEFSLKGDHVPLVLYDLSCFTNGIRNHYGLQYFGVYGDALIFSLDLTDMSYIKTYKFGWDFAAVTVATMASYTWFTVSTTAWRQALICWSRVCGT